MHGGCAGAGGTGISERGSWQIGAFLHTQSRKFYLVALLKELTHLQDSSGKDIERARTGLAQVQFKEVALVIRSVTLWHWQNWSSVAWVGETRVQVH